jgi:hypothetical protein
MGLRTDIARGEGARFSEDVLKIEVYGPNEENLTIIDVPGIFRTTTQGTTKEDMGMVRDLVTSYIKEDRTIILAVLPSNVDIATQEILEIAEEYDKSGVRTVGVLTKPDLVLESGAQAAVCDLVLGKKRPLALGYFLVRNRGEHRDSTEQGDLDQIFQTQPWKFLPQERMGIKSLKEQLTSLLIKITQREFPKLIRDISDQIRNCKRELNDLGPPREDEREQRSFLSHIAGTFQDRARAALSADYNADPMFDNHELRLITHIVNITDVFNYDFQHGAHSRHFKNIEPPQKDVEAVSVPNCVSATGSQSSITDATQAPLTKIGVDKIRPEELIELSDIIVRPHDIPKPSEEVTGWINDIYLDSRGLDLGTFNAHLVSMAFAEQSRKWGDITKIYMSRVIITLHRFIAAALRSVCQEEQSRDKLWAAILDSLVDSYKMAMAQASLLIEVEQRKQPYTLNRQFNESLSKARGYRITELLRGKARRDIKQYGELQLMVNLDDIAKAAESKSNVEQLQEEIHDILQSYYSLALNRFIDNVFQQAVDYQLLHGPSSPLKVFTQDWVINLQPEQLEQIVGETKLAKKRRQKLMRKIDDLSKALKILKI